MQLLTNRIGNMKNEQNLKYGIGQKFKNPAFPAQGVKIMMVFQAFPAFPAHLAPCIHHLGDCDAIL